MIKFDPNNRINNIKGDIYCVSIGKQTNCGGIACVLASISTTSDLNSNKIGLDSLGNISNSHTLFGNDIPIEIQNAVFEGVHETINESLLSYGIVFKLIGILYHPVDSNINMHKIAAIALTKSVIENNA